MGIINKIAEFRKTKLKQCSAVTTYRVGDCDLLELAEMELKKRESTNNPDYLLMSSMDAYYKTNDIIFLKQWFSNNHVKIFGFDIVLDKPLHNKTFNY